MKISTVYAPESYVLSLSYLNICFETGFANNTSINMSKNIPYFMQSLFLTRGSEFFLK